MWPRPGRTVNNDGPGQHNPDPSEGPWGGGRPTLQGGARGLFRRPAHGGRPHHPPDARPGPQRAADGRRRHRVERVHGHRRSRRRGHLMTFGPDARKNPNAKEVVEKFRKKGYEPEAYTLYTYLRADHFEDGGSHQGTGKWVLVERDLG